MPADRAVVFVDGNNLYRGLAEIGVTDRIHLNDAKISRKLIGPREWIGTLYYVGRVTENRRFMRGQQRFLDRLVRTDPRISAHLGRIVKRPAVNPLADEMLRYLANLRIPIAMTLYRHLVWLAQTYKKTPVFVEKEVDVMLAVDMVTMAARGEYEAAYLVSADGDFSHPVRFVGDTGRKVYATAPLPGAQLGKAVNSFIRVDKAWFADCYD